VGGRAPRTSPEGGGEAVVRRALAIVRRCLEQLPPSPQVLELSEQAERLLAATVSWQEFPPSRATRDRVMRAAMSIHLEALWAASAGG